MLLDPKKLEKWGVVDFGYTTLAAPLSLDHYNSWVQKKDHLPLTYLEGERQQKRQNLGNHWPDFKSSLVFLFSYHQSHLELQNFYQNDPAWNGLKLASYTLGFEGADYHHLIKERLIEIAESLKEKFQGLEYKLTLDTHPVLERDLALRAGLGWFGKNSMLINRDHGSFFIIGSLLLNQQLPPELLPDKRGSETDHCGQCNLCALACPTKAIDPLTRSITARDCISTFTIEQFKLDTVPSEKMTLKDGFIFGCDICQDVCPWNKRIDRMNESKSMTLSSAKVAIIDTFLKTHPEQLAQYLKALSEGAFKRLFKNSSLERSGRRGLLKNILFFLSGK